MSKDFRFDYKRYKSRGLTVEKLDEIYLSFTAPTTNIVAQIILVVKLIAFALYMWARRGLINDEMLIEKQEYEAKRRQSQLGDLAEDDLD